MPADQPADRAAPDAGEALLPCPFCGSVHATVLPRNCNRDTTYREGDRAFPVVRCDVCYAEASGPNWSPPWAAVAKWNTRAQAAVAAAAPSAGESVREIVDHHLKALAVLRTMLDRAGLHGGVRVADEMRERATALLTAERSPHKNACRVCGQAGPGCECDHAERSPQPVGDGADAASGRELWAVMTPRERTHFSARIYAARQSAGPPAPDDQAPAPGEQGGG